MMHHIKAAEAAVEWFLGLPPLEHAARSEDVAGHARLFALDAAATTELVGNELVPVASPLESITLGLLEAGRGDLGTELRRSYNELVDRLVDWRAEAAEAIEQWRWDRCTVSDPAEAIELGRPLCDRLEDVRDMARRLGRLLTIARKVVEVVEEKQVEAAQGDELEAVDLTENEIAFLQAALELEAFGGKRLSADDIAARAFRAHECPRRMRDSLVRQGMIDCRPGRGTTLTAKAVGWLKRRAQL